MMIKQNITASFSKRNALRGAALLATLMIATERTSAFTTSPSSVLPRPLATPIAKRGMKAAPLWVTPPESSNLSMETQVHQAKHESDPNTIEESPRKSFNPEPVLVTYFKKLTDDPKAVGGAVAAAALALVLMLSPAPADAAMSGGRMGGSFSAPRQSYSRPAPSSGSFSRGYSSGYRSGFGSGYGSGYLTSPRITVSPFGGISPFYSPSPFYFGGPGAVVYGRGPSFIDLLVFGGISFMILNAIRIAASGTLNPLTSFEEQTSFWSDTPATALGSGTSTVQVSVALEVPNRSDPNSILSVLDRISNTARTDSRVGIQNLTSQVALELLRRKSSIVSASTRYKHFGDRNRAQRDFNSLSIKERGKFENEMVSKYGGVDYGQGSYGRGASPSGSKATMAVVTLMLAIDGDSTKVPTIRSIQDVEDALRKIASDVKVDDCLQSAEILWTPEDPSETLTLREVVADYPELRSV